MRSVSGRLGGGASAIGTRLVPDGPSVAQVLAAFNTWAYKREQPSSLAMIEARIAAAIRAGRPLSMVLCWGKGPRSVIAKPDVACLDFLSGMCSRVSAVHRPGVELTLIFTDTHAELNGHARQDYEAYFGAIERNSGRSFRTTRMSRVLRQAGPISSPLQPAFGEEALERLVQGAERWYRGPEPAGTAAARYLRANMIERLAVEAVYPDAIFVTFNGSELDFLFPPSLPKFYMYSLRKGCSVKPWFIDV